MSQLTTPNVNLPLVSGNDLPSGDPKYKLDFNERCNSFPTWARQALNDMDTDTLWRYPDRSRLEQRLAEHFELTQDQVLVTNGADEAIFLLLSLVGTTRPVILPQPTFSMYDIGAQQWQLNTVPIAPMADQQLDWLGLKEKLPEHPGGLIILVRPNNPSGETAPLTVLREILTEAMRWEQQIIIDEAYVEFAGESALSLLQEFPNITLLRTFSKAYGLAGLRVGYMLASDKKLLAAVRERCLPFNVNSVSLAVAEQALSAEAQQEVKAYCERIAANRDTLSVCFTRYQIPVSNSEGNFLLVRPEAKQKVLLLALLKDAGISVRQFNDGELSPYLRITVSDDIEPLRQVLRLAFAPDLICLDMDGVLIDTSGSYDQAVCETVLHFSGKRVDEKTILEKRMQGGFNNDWLLSQSLLADLGLNLPYDDVIKVFQEFYLGNDEKSGLINEEKVLINKSLRAKLKNYNCCIVTGRPRFEAELGAKLCGLDALPIFSLDDVKEGKPDPEGINKAKALTDAKRVWMCGDNVDDMQAANSAQAVAIGVGRNPALPDHNAKLVLATINELETLLL